MSPTLTIPKKVTKGEDLVIVRRSDYDRLIKDFLEMKNALAKIRHGEKELSSGKARTVQSLAELRR